MPLVKLKDIAKACKSKNAGPFELTLDMMFDNEALYDEVRKSGRITAEVIAKLYQVDVSDVLFTIYPPALAFKATIPRRLASGAIGDTDIYGAQQHAPLLEIEIPLTDNMNELRK